MEFISQLRQEFLYFTSGKHEWKYLKILSHEWNEFHIQHQTIEYPL